MANVLYKLSCWCCFAGTALFYMAGLVLQEQYHVSTDPYKSPLALAMLVTKPVPVLSLAISAFSSTRYQQLMAAGLVLSGIGDVCLDTPSGFILGLLFFLAAHCCYIASLSLPFNCHQLLINRLLLVLPNLAAVLYCLLPHLGSLAVPVCLYVLVEMCVLWRATCRIGLSGECSMAHTCGVVGGCMFLVSDGVLALNRWDCVGGIKGVHVVIMSTYWTAQVCLRLSAERKTEWFAFLQ